MFQKPKTAKRLYFDVIPRNVDDYLVELQRHVSQDAKEQLSNGVWHVHDGAPPEPEPGVTFNMLLNLVSVCHSDDPVVLWHYITRHAPAATPGTSPILDNLVRFAIAYYTDFVLPTKHYRQATAEERAALADLRSVLADMSADASADDIQTDVYEVGKRHECFGSLRDWFEALYQILLGQDSGPRMGSFIALYGLDETLALLDRAIAGDDLAAE